MLILAHEPRMQQTRHVCVCLTASHLIGSNPIIGNMHRIANVLA